MGPGDYFEKTHHFISKGLRAAAALMQWLPRSSYRPSAGLLCHQQQLNLNCCLLLIVAPLPQGGGVLSCHIYIID